MSKLRHMLVKLQGRTIKELRVRGAQTFNAMAERQGWSSLARLPDDGTFLRLIDRRLLRNGEVSAAALLEHFHRRSEPHFFRAFSEKQETTNALRSRFDSPAVLDRARRISEGSFDLLGFHDLRFGMPINWHMEPVSGVIAPKKHWSQISYLDASQAGDKKIIWELNRHAYLATLGRAYWRTQDDLYAQTFAAHVNSWIDANPPKLGINWASSLEIAFRAISWLWALYFFRDSNQLDPRLFLRVMKLLYLHGRHLETYLSTYFSPNTHLTGEALGLFYLGTLLPEFRCAGRWRDLGEDILLAQLDHHVRPDGVYFEQSSYYHRYTTDFYTHLVILLRENDRRIAPQLAEKLKALLDHLMFITRPDGTTPLFGDDDGGRLVFLNENAADDFRSALSNGAALFNRPDYKYVAGEVSEETLWLFGQQGLQVFDELEANPPARQSIGFPDGGYYVMRDGWTRNANYLMMDCGPHGALKHGHAHADALAIDVAPHGRTLLPDPGTFSYTGSREMRDWFRSSAAHNTLTVDGESSSISAGPFSWRSVARAETSAWISREQFDYLEGQHDGYKRLANSVTHKRGILFIKGGYWVINDQVASEAQHNYEVWFHFSRAATAEIDTKAGFVSCRLPGDLGLKIFAFGPGGSWRAEDGWISHSYGEKGQAPVCVFSGRADKGRFISFLLPIAGKLKNAHVREIETIGGQGFEVASENDLDVVMIKDGRRVETARLASSFNYTWARFTREGASNPEQLVLIGGDSLELDGKEILKSNRRIDFLSASRQGDQFRVETDLGILDLSLPIRDLESVFSDLNSAS